ncbi:septation protein A [Paenalcaligenes niemegkensis]|uniref:septation protein A n=1 Tax=Paenalcaligenes niemegkensis TaxID=2895469 RepID=UPI001EE97E5F|nr:septation protein A [Paenalcaligenes niemegkensis]MCQ9616911.1 septation protein A [Paenalcaligenes niemegkensis]
MKKLLFDLFPLILFFIAFRNFDIYTATGVTMAAAASQILWLKARRKPIETTHWINLAVIGVFGSATLFFQNDAFIKWKPTVLYWVFAAILLGSHWLLQRNLMQKIMGGQIVLPGKVWDKMNYSWALFFIVSGALNLYVAFSGRFSESQWVNFKVFGLMGLLIVFVIIQSLWLGRYLKDHSAANDDQI